MTKGTTLVCCVQLLIQWFEALSMEPYQCDRGGLYGSDVVTGHCYGKLSLQE